MKSGPAVLSALAALAIPAEAAAADTFCQRLAPMLDMKAVTNSDGSVEEWKVNTVGLGKALLGGAVANSVGVGPVNPATVDDYRRLENTCAAVKKGAVCKIDGPMTVKITTRKGSIRLDAEEGERPTILIKNTTIYCRDTQEGLH